MYEIGDFCIAKVLLSHDHKLYDGKSYKKRPVLIIGVVGRFYKCLPITSLLKDSITRIDIFTNYNFEKHSQIICNNAILLNEKSFDKKICHCRPDDFEYIVERYKDIYNKGEKNNENYAY